MPASVVVYADRLRPSVAPDALPCQNELGAVAHEVEKVVKPSFRIRLGPSMELIGCRAPAAASATLGRFSHIGILSMFPAALSQRHVW